MVMPMNGMYIHKYNISLCIYFSVYLFQCRKLQYIEMLENTHSIDVNTTYSQEILVNATYAQNLEMQCIGDVNCQTSIIYCPNNPNIIDGYWGTSCMYIMYVYFVQSYVIQIYESIIAFKIN